MDNKNSLIRILEFYINNHKNKEVELMYGTGSQIKIVSFEYSTNLKSLFVEAKIILGEEINESVLERSLADVLIVDAISYIYPNEPVKISVSYDV